MAKFRKKPVVIEAKQWFNHGDHAMVEPHDPEKAGAYITGLGPYGWIKTLEGGHVVSPGDWIITGVKGEHYPCKPDIFAATYDAEPEPAVSTVPPHQQRVVDEHAECLERLRKLRAFIGDAKGPFRQLDDAERHRLMHQEDVMTELATVLAERVAAFQSAPVGDDFPLGKACDLSGDTACEACQ